MSCYYASVSLIYISGVSATGKSAVLEVLSRKGYKTYDSDNGGIAAWYNKKTGQREQLAPSAAGRPDTWYENHSWNLSRARVEAISNEASSAVIFLCGSTLSDIDVWDLFTKVICLTIDEATLKHRLLSRTTNDWGKTRFEYNHVLKWRRPWEERNRKLGAIMVDASGPLEAVVQQVVAQI